MSRPNLIIGSMNDGLHLVQEWFAKTTDYWFDRREEMKTRFVSRGSSSYVTIKCFQENTVTTQFQNNVIYTEQQ